MKNTTRWTVFLYLSTKVSILTYFLPPNTIHCWNIQPQKTMQIMHSHDSLNMETILLESCIQYSSTTQLTNCCILSIIVGIKKNKMLSYRRKTVLQGAL